MAQSLLYYPTININDGLWLRNAILYWDEVCSIVPDDKYTDLSPELYYLQDKNKYRAIYPNDIFSRCDIKEFINKFNFRISRCYSSKDNNNYFCDKSLYNYIHYKKIPYELIEEIRNNKFIRINEGSKWVEMEAKVSEIYMRTLAEFAAKYDKKDMVISTDKYYRLNDIFKQTNTYNGEHVLALTLMDCLPAPSMETSFEDIVHFKLKRKDELHNIRQQIRELELNISNSESIKELKFVMESFKESWQNELKDADKLFKDGGIKYYLGGLRAFVGGAFTANEIISNILEHTEMNIPSNGLKIAVGLAGFLGVGVQARNYKNKIKPRNDSTGFAYVLEAYKEGLLNRYEEI